MSRRLGLADDLRRPPDVVRRDPADLRHPLRRVRRPPSSRAPRCRPCAPPRTRGRPMSFSISCCASPFSTARFVPGRIARCTSAARADCVSRGSITIERGGSGPVQPVELVHPQHRLRLGRVDPDVQDRVAVLDVVDAGRLAVAAERLLQRLARRRGAEARVAVEVIRADPATRDERERVVVLEEQLAARVEAERAAALRRQQLPRALDDETPSPRPSSPRAARRPAARAGAAAGRPRCWPASRTAPSGRDARG